MKYHDKNNREIKTGDIVEITGAYFKNDNGLWLVVAASEDETTIGGDLTLHKMGKTGKLLESGNTTSFWPLKSYCSDWRKNRAAKEHNKENAKIEKVETVNTWYAAEYFRKQAEKYEESAERRERLGERPDEVESLRSTAAFYKATADRLSKTAQKPKEKAPEIGIRFFWNGIKVDGGKLVPCYMDISGDKVNIMAKEYGGHLPEKYFTVINETDSMTDYFETDRASLTPEHPLYKFARYAALKGIMNGRTYRKPTEDQRREWDQMKDPGQPTAADLAAVEELKTAQESARLAQEQAEQLAQREAFLAKQNAGRIYIEQAAEAYPLQAGAPRVVIRWSENPAFYSWEESELVLSVAAAEIVLKHFDEDRHEQNEKENRGGYDKTAFEIWYNDPETGAEHSYEGRYDLGDNDGGLIAHIRAFGESHRKPGPFHDEQQADEIAKFADYLAGYTAAGRVVSVTVPAWFKQAAAQYKKQKEQRQQEEQEEAKRDFQDIMDAVAIMTDEQLEMAVRAISPTDREKLDVARFFLQELMRRDRKKALELFRDWTKGTV